MKSSLFAFLLAATSFGAVSNVAGQELAPKGMDHDVLEILKLQKNLDSLLHQDQIYTPSTGETIDVRGMTRAAKFQMVRSNLPARQKEILSSLPADPGSGGMIDKFKRISPRDLQNAAKTLDEQKKEEERQQQMQSEPVTYKGNLDPMQFANAPFIQPATDFKVPQAGSLTYSGPSMSERTTSPHKSV